jgi:hypothetical protein
MEVLDELKQLGDELKSAWEEYKSQDEQRARGGQDPRRGLGRDEGVDRRDRHAPRRARRAHAEAAPRRLQGRARPRQARGQGVREAVPQGPGALTEDEVKHIRSPEDRRRAREEDDDVGDDTTGGFLAPVEIVNELIKGIVSVQPDPRRRERPPDLVQLDQGAEAHADERRGLGRRGRQPHRDEQNVKFGKEEISTRELSAMADISRQDLEDTSGQRSTSSSSTTSPSSSASPKARVRLRRRRRRQARRDPHRERPGLPGRERHRDDRHRERDTRSSATT